MSDYLDLYDYRRRVATMYRERTEAIMAGADPLAVWQRFREVRDDLFAHHPQSALDEAQKRDFQGLPYFPYNPMMRFVADVDTNVEPIRQSVVMNASESMTMVTVGRYLFDTIKGSDFLPVAGVNGWERIMLDFNYAYNPSCASNDQWVCPLAPVENRLNIPIRAGEMKQRRVLRSVA